VGQYFDVLKFYPAGKGRADERPVITEEQREISRQFGYDYFDGDRKYGYGGYSYHPRFWTQTVEHIAAHYGLSETSAVLDVGCGKGFMLKDLHLLLPGATLAGVDISPYAVRTAESEVSQFIVEGCASSLPFDDESFDLVLSINTIHNLDREGCIQALAEIQRVTRRDACVVVDAWSTEEEHEAMMAWVLTAKTMLRTDGWLRTFEDAEYTGDYSFWTVS